MKVFPVFLLFLLFSNCSTAKDKTYIASTPCGELMKGFLEIPLQDSIDFIRWKLVINDRTYQLQCHYGISKPNTNGFMDGGSKIDLKGECKRVNNYYEIYHKGRMLRMVVLNDDLLHVLNTDNSLLIGNGGWSYTLNNTSAVGTDKLSLNAGPTVFKDSVGFEGRTPCKVPGVIAEGSLCYKLKWYIIFYMGQPGDKTGDYKVLGTPWRIEGRRKGRWTMAINKNGKTIYQLDHADGAGSLYLLKLDDGVMIFTDAQGKLLVGDEDFSYTLNRRSWK